MLKEVDTLHSRAVIILAVLAVFTVMKLAASVLVPLAFAGFLIALAWPVKSWLSRRLPNVIADVGSFIAVILILGSFIAAVWLSMAEIIDTLPKYEDDIQHFWRDAKYELTLKGVDTSEDVQLEEVRNVFLQLFSKFYSAIAALILISAYVIFALPEIARWKSKLRNALGKERSETLLSTGTKLRESFKTYLVSLLLTSLLSAAGTWVAAFSTGIDFAFSWGVLAFLMNLIPIIGAILMIIPPTIFAFLQFDDMQTPLMVLASFSVVQIIVGNIIDPIVQGNMLSISPLIIIFSLSFWGFLWGVPGAFLAVPLTHSIIVTCRHYEQTRWIAILLSEGRKPVSE